MKCRRSTREEQEVADPDLSLEDVVGLGDDLVVTAYKVVIKQSVPLRNYLNYNYLIGRGRGPSDGPADVLLEGGEAGVRG